LGILLHVNLHAAYKCVTIAIFNTLGRAAESIHQFLLYSDDADYREISVKFTYRSTIIHPIISLKRYQDIQDIWAVLSKRRIVGRPLWWLNNFRRLAKRFRNINGTSENMIRIAMIRITHRKMRLMFSQSTFKVSTMKSELLRLYFLPHPYCQVFGLMP
jgi:hypothetical protein